VEEKKMKAIILAAGVGSRIRPLTDNCPKSLLKVDGKTILEMMISHIQSCGITEIVFVLGYLKEQIKEYVKERFPDLNAHFIINDQYEDTNTGYSLMLTKDVVGDSAFIKFDADVVFDKEILKRLIESEHDNCLCVDKNIHLDAEEVKVISDSSGRVIKASKAVDPKEAVGESVGIEKISGKITKELFAELDEMMGEKQNHQEYYEAAYERLIGNSVPFYMLDITGLDWVEIDTLEDFSNAKRIFEQ
jgi:choline kinase